VGNGLSTTIQYLRQTTSGAASSGLGARIKCLRRTTSAAAGYGLGTAIKYLRGTAGIALGTTIKVMIQRPGPHDQVSATHDERRRCQRPWQHDQVSLTHNEWSRGQRLEPVPGNPDVNLTPPCLRSPDFVRAPRPSAKRRTRRPVRCPRQPRQRPTTAAPSCARHFARQLKKEILNTFPTISSCFVLGCRCIVPRIYCDGQYFYWAAGLAFGNKRGN
jgi:hypothetical protein